MTEFEELPDGITLNQSNSKIQYDVEYETVDNIQCDKCDLIYRSCLIKNGSRNDGCIIIIPSEVTIWKNSLSKNRDKAIKNLSETFALKFDKHKEWCNND